MFELDSGMFTVSETFLEKLVEEFKDENTIGFLLTGSVARGDATRFSDIDLLKFAADESLQTEENYVLKYRENRLISLSTTTIKEKLNEIKKPETAIWAIPGLRQAKILLDKGGLLAGLQKTAKDFEWISLQKAADEFASVNLMGYAEEVHKILGALKLKDESAVLCGTIGLLLGLTKIVAVRHGLLIESENSFFRQVQNEIGEDSEWSFQHKIACGFEQNSTVGIRAVASLRLYVETEKVVRNVIKPVHSEVINKTVEILNNSSIIKQ